MIFNCINHTMARFIYTSDPSSLHFCQSLYLILRFSIFFLTQSFLIYPFFLKSNNCTGKFSYSEFFIQYFVFPTYIPVCDLVVTYHSFIVLRFLFYNHYQERKVGTDYHEFHHNDLVILINWMLI